MSENLSGGVLMFSGSPCVLVEFSVECVPGFLFVKGKLYFNSSLESVYFYFGIG